MKNNLTSYPKKIRVELDVLPRVQLFVVDIGNTFSKFGLLRNGRFGKIGRIETANIAELPFPEGVPAAASTVVPSAKDKLAYLPIFWLSPDVRTGLDLGSIRRNTVGMDRLANVIAAAAFFGTPSIVGDFGTAITLDMVDAKGIYLGGIIMPGRSTMRKSLHEFTAQIPLVPLEKKIGRIPGRNTVEAVSGGIDAGLVGAVKELVARMAASAGKRAGPKLVAVGGDAGFFVRNIPGFVFGGDDFTLKGIAAAWYLNNKPGEFCAPISKRG